MIIFVQYPIADVRRFIEKETFRLVKPTWPIPEHGREFVRSYGIATRRGRGGIEGWIGESRVVSASGAFRLISPLRFSLHSVEKKNSPPSTIFLKNPSRHLFSDGLALAKLETVFVTRALPKSTLLRIDELLNSLLDVQVRVTLPGVGSEIIPFGQIPNALGLSYHLATTSSKAKSYVNSNRWQVAIKKPIIYVELSERENHHIPKTARKIIGERFADIYWWMQKHNNIEYLVWSTRYRKQPTVPKTIRRQFRISVLRLHAEYQILQYVIQAIVRRKITYTGRSTASGFLQTYINEVTGRISQSNGQIEKLPNLSRGYISMWDVRALVGKCFEAIDPGHTDSIFQAIRNLDLRPQVGDKLGDIIINEVIMGNKIQNAAIIGEVHSTGDINITQRQYSQWDSEFGEINYKSLAKELRKLKKAMAKQASAPGHDEEIASVTSAIDNATKQNGHFVVDTLSRVSRWTLQIAKELGLEIVSSILTKLIFPSMGA